MRLEAASLAAAVVFGTSFGTVVGLGVIYLLYISDFPRENVLTAISIGVCTVAIGFGIMMFSLKSKESKKKKKFTFTPLESSEITKTKANTNTNTSSCSGIHLLESKYLKGGDVEDPFTKAVAERNRILGLSRPINEEFDSLEEFYGAVHGKCCESVIGAIWLPIGVVGPLPLSGLGRSVYVPLATVEGALVASVNRGCKALRLGSSLSSLVSTGRRKGITRGPSFRAPTIERAAAFLAAFEDLERFEEWRKVFDSSSPGGHVRLIEIRGRQIGTYVYLRVRCDTSEAMGMNMVSRGCSVLFEHVLSEFSDIRMTALSGNYCVDKKPAAMNWIDGRGREVISSVRISSTVLKQVFGVSDGNRLVELNLSKNLIGSAAAGSVGGFNAQVANVVAAFYLAMGQDVAQVVDASQALTLLEFDSPADELVATLTMPCIELGIRGGGTGLPHQRRCLQMVLGTEAASDRVDELAKCLGLLALAGELSLLAALETDTLLSAHMKFNH